MTKRPPHLLTPTRVSTAKFEVIDRQRRVYSTEASTLGPLHLTNVYNDACDLGFTLVGANNGIEAIFAETNEDRDADGELQGSWFACVWPPKMKKAGWRALIVND